MSPLETSSFAQKERILSPRMALITLNCIIIYEVLKQINMIFSYTYKLHLKPLLFSDFSVKPRVNTDPTNFTKLFFRKFPNFEFQSINIINIPLFALF